MSTPPTSLQPWDMVHFLVTCLWYICGGVQIQIDPYLEESACDVCGREPGVYFCRNFRCFRYYCRVCWQVNHCSGTPACYHKPLMRNNKSSASAAGYGMQASAGMLWWRAVVSVLGHADQIFVQFSCLDVCDISYWWAQYVSHDMFHLLIFLFILLIILIGSFWWVCCQSYSTEYIFLCLIRCKWAWSPLYVGMASVSGIGFCKRAWLLFRRLLHRLTLHAEHLSVCRFIFFVVF